MNDFLIRLYNTLSAISTKGEDTILMSDCLRAIKEYISEHQEEVIKREE